MKIITVTNHKGGTGKTFISVVLAELFMAEKKRVSVVDLDENFNAVEYLRRPDGQPEFNGISVFASAGAEPDFDALRDYDYVIVDTPPVSYTNKIVRRVMLRSDLIVCPFTLFRHAILAVQDLFAIIPPELRVLPVCSVRGGLSKPDAELLSAVRAAFVGGGNVAPLVEIPFYARVNTNLADKRVFWFRLSESEFERFDALRAAVVKSVK